MGRKRSKGALSPGEERLVDNFIDDICDQLGLRTRNADLRYYHNLGWEGFLEVYRNQPDSFRGSGRRGWSSAALVIYELLREEKRGRDFDLYRTIPADTPVPEENKTPLLDLLCHGGGDPQNSVCFWDYLERLSAETEDAAFLAYRLIDRETLEEIRCVYDWPPDRLYRAFNTLRAAMEEYLKI